MISPTYTDETVEKIACELCIALSAVCIEAACKTGCGDTRRALREYGDLARAVLAVIPRPSTGSDAGDLVKRLENATVAVDPAQRGRFRFVDVALLREAAASIAALSEENTKLREYCASSAEDYASMAETLRKGWPDAFPKSIRDALDSAAILKRIAAGEDVWPEYQAELLKEKNRASALSEENERLKAALEPFAAHERKRAEAEAEMTKYVDGIEDEWRLSVIADRRGDLTVGDFRRAAKLGQMKGEG